MDKEVKSRSAIPSISAQIDANGQCDKRLEEGVQVAKIEQEDLSTRVINKLRKIPASGFTIAVMSSVCFATASFIVKLVPNVNPTEIVVIRSLIQMIVYMPIIIYNRFNLFGAPGERIHSLVRGFLGFISFGCCYTSYRLMPLADASTILFSSPVYVSIFACVMLKEECGLFQIFSIVMTMVGVLLVSRPTVIFGSDTDEGHTAGHYYSGGERTEGSLMALASAVSSAMVIVIIRKMKNTPSAVTINVFSMYSVFFGLLYLILVDNVFYEHVPHLAEGMRVPTEWKEILLLLINGICGVLGQLGLTVSLKLEEAGLVSVARTFDILMAFIYQVSFLPGDSKHLSTSIIGALIVSLTVSLTGIRRWLLSKPGKWNLLWTILSFGKKRDGQVDESS